jgi:hypothetical protein
MEESVVLLVCESKKGTAAVSYYEYLLHSSLDKVIHDTLKVCV